MARKPRKPRDYKAEYQRSKARAKSAGYASEREYKRARKALALPPRTSPVPRKVLEREQPSFFSTRKRRGESILSWLRRESKDWSNAHSHTNASRYRDSMSDDEVRRYHRAFVERIEVGSRRGKARERRQRIKDWLVPDILSAEEWEQNYGPV